MIQLFACRPRGGWQSWTTLGWFNDLRQLDKVRHLFHARGAICSDCGLDVRSVSQDAVDDISFDGIEREVNQAICLTGYLQVRPSDGDYNSHPGDWIVVCPFCHLSYYAFEAVEEDRATVIYAPWINQEHINALLAITAAIRMDDGHVFYRESRDLQQTLSGLAGLVRHQLPVLDMISTGSEEDGTGGVSERIRSLVRAWRTGSIPEDLGNAISSSLRLLPSTAFVDVAIPYWREVILSRYPTSEWGQRGG